MVKHRARDMLVLTATMIVSIVTSSCSSSSPATAAPAVNDAGGPTAQGDAAAPDGGGELVTDGGGEPVTVVLLNAGTGALEGHTPRGFQGMGTGLFVGDNLNPNFPIGDGVQAFLSFDVSALPAGRVMTAELRSTRAHVSGDPFGKLGTLSAEEFRYDAFSSALWDKTPLAGGVTCTLATSAAGPYACDVAGVVQRSADERYKYAQFRLRLAKAGDGDMDQDLISFYVKSANDNVAGIFELEVTIGPP